MGDRLFYRESFLHQEGCGAPSSSLRRWRIFGGKEEDSSSSRLAMLVSVPGPSSTNSDPVADGGFATPCRPAPPRHGIARRHRAKTCFSPLIRYGRIFSIGESPGQGSPYRCSSPRADHKVRYGNISYIAKRCDSPPQITNWGYVKISALTCTQVVSFTVSGSDGTKLSRMNCRLRRKECYVRFWL